MKYCTCDICLASKASFAFENKLDSNLTLKYKSVIDLYQPWLEVRDEVDEIHAKICGMWHNNKQYIDKKAYNIFGELIQNPTEPVTSIILKYDETDKHEQCIASRKVMEGCNCDFCIVNAAVDAFRQELSPELHGEFDTVMGLHYFAWLNVWNEYRALKKFILDPSKDKKIWVGDKLYKVRVVDYSVN